MTTDSEFVVTFRGVVVPAWIASLDDDEGYNADAVREAFRDGVIALAEKIDGIYQEHEKAVEAMQKVELDGITEPPRDRRYRDEDGDIWSYTEGAGWSYTRRGFIGHPYPLWEDVREAFSAGFLADWTVLEDA